MLINQLRTLTIALTVVMLSALAAVLPARAAVLYEQPWIAGGPRGASQGVYTTYDDFVLESDSLITNVGWAGFTYGQDPAGSGPFTISFFEDSNSAPGNLLSSSLMSAGDMVFSPIPQFAAWSVYDMSGDLQTPFVATAGSRYWLSVYSTSLTTFFAWDGTGIVNSLSYETDSRRPGEFTRWYADYTMRLSGEPITTAIPEPGSLALMLGAVPVTLLRKRR